MEPTNSWTRDNLAGHLTTTSTTGKRHQLLFLVHQIRQQGEVPRHRRQPEAEAERHRVDRRRRQRRRRKRRQEVGTRLHNPGSLRRGIRSGKTMYLGSSSIE